MEAHRVLKENNFNVSPTIIESAVYDNSRGFAAVMSAAAQTTAVTADRNRCHACLQLHLPDVMNVFVDRQTGRAVLQASTTRSNSCLITAAAAESPVLHVSCKPQLHTHFHTLKTSSEKLHLMKVQHTSKYMAAVNK
jgi:hypothetical protein